MFIYRKLSVFVIALTLLLYPANCLGGSGASLFKLPINARRLGMGQISVGSVVNPDGLSRATPGERGNNEPVISSLYSNQFGELSYAAAEFQSNNFGISYRELRSGELKERNFRGEPTGDTFRYRRRGLAGHFRKSINSVKLELKGRLLQKRVSANYIGGSLSPSFTCEIRPFVFVAGFSNLITSELFGQDEGSSPWTRELTFGLGFNGKRLNLGLDLEAEFHDRGVEPNGIRFGSEWWITDFAAVRFGIMDQLRHTIGWGIRGGNIRVDYAFLRHAELPNSHFISFGWIFGD